MNCKYWKNCGVIGGGCCELGLYGGQPSFGVCNQCDQREPLPRQKKQRRNLLYAASNAAKAAQSVVQVTVSAKHRASPEHHADRLSVCRSCEHAKWKVNRHGGRSLHTCGEMLKSITDPDAPTCGCVLDKKAKDKRQNCPMDKWKSVDEKYAD